MSVHQLSFYTPCEYVKVASHLPPSSVFGNLRQWEQTVQKRALKSNLSATVQLTENRTSCAEELQIGFVQGLGQSNKMVFGVFIHRTDSIYDDVPSERYQFPKQYLTRVLQCEGDLVIYLEPSKVKNTKGYFAVAKVQEVIPDPRNADMHLAVIEPGTYLDFGDPVPFRGADNVVEKGLLNDHGKISGRAQAAVRPLSSEDFAQIVERGLGQVDDILPRIDREMGTDGFQEPQVPFWHLSARERVNLLANRVVRDRNFRKNVLRAYGECCAITGLRLINGGAPYDAAMQHPPTGHSCLQQHFRSGNVADAGQSELS